ncbi:MAG: hypothetical protein HZB46_02680 [Solirubrobacterales bacterium]|nr:hypothetical protein [Solirubrobacterales bacterium]
MAVPGTVPALRGAPLRDADGITLGAVEALLSDADRAPAWLVVRLAGGRLTVVPAAGAHPSLTRVPFPGDIVRACPVTLGEPGLRHEHALAACRHYRVRPPAGTRIPLHAPAAPARELVAA